MLRFAFLLAFMLFSLPVFAETPGYDPSDPYTVTGISVDAKGANGSEARDKAFTDGGRSALAALAAKISGAKDPDFKSVDNNTISRLIKSFEVETEKTSGARYIAKLTYHFKPSITDNFLTSHGMSIKDPSELSNDQQPASSSTATGTNPVPTQRIVVLPIIRSGDRSVLWEERTDWARAWENYMSDHPNANVVVPGGEMADINTISVTEAMSGLPGPLTKIMQNYEAQGVLVAVLSAPTLTPTPERDLNVQLSIYGKDATIRNTSSYNMAAATNKKPMEWLQDGAGAAVAKWQSEAQKMIANPRKPALHDAAITPNGMLQLAINVPFSSPQQWQSERAALQETNGITRFDVVGLTHTNATALITYQGSRASLENALREKGLRLEQTSPTSPVTLVASNSRASIAPAPGTTMQPASTFQTVYPPPPVPRDEVIYADPDSKNSDNDDSSSDDATSDALNKERAPPPPVTSKKAPPATRTPNGVQSQELPPLIP